MGQINYELAVVPAKKQSAIPSSLAELAHSWRTGSLYGKVSKLAGGGPFSSEVSRYMLEEP